MDVRYEQRVFDNEVRMWMGTYYNLYNIAHYHREEEMVFVESGTVRITVNGTGYICTAGDLAILAGGSIHQIEMQEPCVTDILIFDTAPYETELALFEHGQPLLRAEMLRENGIDVSLIFSMLRGELNVKGALYERYLESIMRAFLILCGRCLPPAEEVGKPVMPEGQFRQLFDLIAQEYATVTFQDAAKFVHYSPAYFSKKFKALTGMRFTDYLNYIRIEQAVNRLKMSNRAVADIAEECGFESIRHFNRIFREITGITPREVRTDFVFTTNPTSVGDPTVSFEKLLR